MKNILLLLLILLMQSSFSFSQTIEEISTDRPDRTDSPDIIPFKFIQFESGLSYEKSTDGKGLNTDSYSLPELMIRYGVYNNIEFRLAFENSLESNSVSGLKENHFGLKPLEIGAKINLLQEKYLIPKTSFIIEIAIPGTSSKRYDIKHVAPGLIFLFSNTISENAELSYNLGINWNTDEKTKTGFYSVSFGLSAFNKTSFYIESYGVFTDRFLPDLRMDYGAVYALSKNIQLDISSGIGLTKVSPDFFLGLGFSIRLPK